MSLDANKEPISPRKVEGEDGKGPNTRYLSLSVGVHLVVAVLLLFSWQCSESVKPVKVPSSVQARVLSAEEIAMLRERSESKKAELRKAEAAKKKEAELKRKKKLEARRKAEAKKKAEARKKAEAKKKAALAKKKKQEAEKARQEKIRKEAEEKRVKELQAREAREKERQRLEQERLEKERQEAELKQARDLKRKEREKRLAEKLAQATQTSESSSPSFNSEELSERDKFIGLIRSRIENRWHIPPKSEGLRVVLRIRLLPSGDLSGVEIIESSGSGVFDQSAVNAMNSVRAFPVPQDSEMFEAFFRVFVAPFSPSED